MYEYSDAERKQLQSVADFNTNHGPGTWVSYPTKGRTQHGQVYGKAIVVGSGPEMKAIVSVTRHVRPVSLSDITVIPEQPDGIEQDSYDRPDPHRAAERVIAYISAWGDGIIDTTTDGQPLYARDLESVCRAVLAEVAA